MRPSAPPTNVTGIFGSSGGKVEPHEDALAAIRRELGEASATTLDWTFHLLGQHPAVEAELLNELQSQLGGRPALASDLPHLPYLKQVVQESMRLYPPVWGISRKAEEEAEFGDYRIPQGAYVVVLPYTLHRHPDWWPDPERFDPSRFSLGGNSNSAD